MKKEGISMIYKAGMALPQKEDGKTALFLAGSIDLELPSNWRENIINEMPQDVHFFDPTCAEHNRLDDQEMERHIRWELDALEKADKVLLNFLPNSESPISLVELGLYTFTDKLIVVCPEAFHKYRYVKVLCDEYNTPLFHVLDEAIVFMKANLQ